MPFAVDPAGVDEAALKAALAAAGTRSCDAALALAEAKAQNVAGRHLGATVLGADQLLACDGVWYDKPAGRADAAATLRRLRGRTHKLISAAAAVRQGRVVWRHVATAQLTMRAFDDAFIERYLDACGDGVLGAVGAYHLEGRGAQLFERIEGDYFTVLGLPLLPVLAFLRGENLL